MVDIRNLCTIIDGNVPVADFPGPANYQGNGSFLIFDFGKEVGGIVTVKYNASATGKVGLAFSESANHTGLWSDDSNGSMNPDGQIYGDLTRTTYGCYTMPDAKFRGGFRYLTIFVTTTEPGIEFNITDITVEIGYQPAWSNLRAYGGYFYSDDELLNRIWYSGAYTLQTTAAPTNTGRAWPILSSGWENDMNLGTNASTAYMDGAKRDRTLWSGDLAVAVPSILVSLGDSEGVKSTLQALYNKSTGELPFAGPPINVFGSDTYHMSAIIATYEYILYTNDQEFLATSWPKYQLAMTFITTKIDNTSLLYVTGTNDWGRLTQGGHNSEANMLLYRVLTTASVVAAWASNSTLSTTWKSLAHTLRSSITNRLFSATTGAFYDSDTNPNLYPQDANSMALAYSVSPLNTTSSISTQLLTNWSPIGAVSPELPNNIVACSSSIEVKAHLVSRNPARSLALMRLSWGWYLNNPFGTQSTYIEGYLSDGTWGYRSAHGYNGDDSYTSHSHGWGTGPVEVLVTGMVGIQLIGPGGSEWSFVPQFGDLERAEGGVTAALGKFSAGWSLTGKTGYAYWYDVPVETNGTLVLPAGNVMPRVDVDGVLVEGTYDDVLRTFKISGKGGSHSLTITY
ncbi:hypothetical protein EYC84_010010 [Monilinia fructicola]|uniref:Uncharacterized protein n=1 Tax=Monilinia fructicola TaxID=38448 RepID=A0A5M9JF15_MONFR|nr:hypothetical protein EYC84_010010 [Monilinia fructicola]